MATYIVSRQFKGSPTVGEPVEVPDLHRANVLMRRGYIIPLKGEATSGNLKEVVTTAISLIAVSKLDEFLAVVEDAAALTAALEAETRETAVPLIEARLEELAG